MEDTDVTAAGMYVGHYMAWLCASILYALQLYRDPGNTDVLPGPMAHKAAGLAGVICVIVAGWTTANPTIYRAGLAFQAIVPKVSRFKVTLATGLIATVAGMFPVIAMKLLDFVAIYGMVLMPMGAVIFVDYWFARRLGFQQNYAEQSGESFNWAAGVTWFATVAVCVAMVVYGNVEIFFVSLPGWFIAAALYIVVSHIYQRRIHRTTTFCRLMQAISWASIAAVVVPGLLFLSGTLELDRVKLIMIAGTVVWFISTPLWMGRQSANDRFPKES